MLDPKTLVLLIPVILFALTIHEYAHGLVAYRLGDPTAKNAGRLTLNPLVHLDPIGTIMLILVHFGWAKPVPVDPRYFDNPKRDMLWVALAGPLANIGLALISGLALRMIGAMPELVGRGSVGSGVVAMFYLSLQINLALAIFNVLPIPPLDGSKILYGILPAEYGHMIHNLERYGPSVLFGLVMFGMLTGVSIFWMFIGPFVRFGAYLFAGI